MSKKLFFEVPGIVCFVESCLRQAPLEIREWAKLAPLINSAKKGKFLTGQAPLEIREWAKLAPLINSAKKGKFLTGQARILEMVKVIRARCTKRAC